MQAPGGPGVLPDGPFVRTSGGQPHRFRYSPTPGPVFDTDTWTGNACVTESGKHALVAYAPHTFTNERELMARGAFTAAVDLTNGEVRKLPYQASLAYFSPGCGAGGKGVISQLTDERTTPAKNETRLVAVDARTGKTFKPVTARGRRPPPYPPSTTSSRRGETRW